MKKKLFLLLSLVIAVFSVFNFVSAEELMYVNIYDESLESLTSVYYASEHKEVKIPYITSVSNMRVVLDEDIAHSGITMATEEIEVQKHLKGLQIMYNTDSITIKGSIDYPIIISENVVLEGEITGDAVIYAPNIVIKGDAVVKGDILVSATNLKIQGKVNGSVIASVSGECTVTGSVDGDLRISTSALNVEEGTLNGSILVKTENDMSALLEKYPNAVIEKQDGEDTKYDIKDTIITGVMLTIVFTVIAYVIVRKDDNIFTKLLNKVKGKSMNVVLSGIAVLLPSILLVILLVILSVLGLWVIGVPIMLVYIAYIAVCTMLSLVIIGTTIFEAIKYTVIKKYEQNITLKKLGLLFGIFVVLYVLTVIPFISKYVIMTLCIISTGFVTTALFGKNK